MDVKQVFTNEGDLIDGPLILKNSIYKDSRGYFQEIWSKKEFDEITKQNLNFVQDNFSFSIKGVLRGMHYQINPKPQDKLVRCIQGTIFDVIIDLRKNSPTFCKWAGVELSDENFLQLWVPKGFAHGFLTISKNAKIEYKLTEYWSKEHERIINYNDKNIKINWPDINKKVILSDKDKNAPNLIAIKNSEFFEENL